VFTELIEGDGTPSQFYSLVLSLLVRLGSRRLFSNDLESWHLRGYPARSGMAVPLGFTSLDFPNQRGRSSQYNRHTVTLRLRMMALSRPQAIHRGPGLVTLAVQNTIRWQKEIQDIQSVLLGVGYQAHNRDVQHV
jgi:hypothetical protein